MPSKPFHVYILLCSDGTYYTGHTDDLDARFAEHESGKYEGYTKSRRPVKLLWATDFTSRIETLEAEKQIKGWTRAKKEALMNGDFDLIRELAKKKDWIGYVSRNP
jgi:predicted GIY-YIG superfamily endonuclease